MENLKFGDLLRNNSENSQLSEKNIILTHIKKTVYPILEETSLKGKNCYRLQVSEYYGNVFLRENFELVEQFVKNDGFSAKYVHDHSDYGEDGSYILFSW